MTPRHLLVLFDPPLSLHDVIIPVIVKLLCRNLRGPDPGFREDSLGCESNSIPDSAPYTTTSGRDCVMSLRLCLRGTCPQKFDSSLAPFADRAELRCWSLLRMSGVQGYLAHKKLPLPRTLQYTYGPSVVPREGASL